MKQKKLKNILFPPMLIVISIGLFFTACENDMQQVKQFSSYKNEPLRTSENLKVVYSELGKIKVKVVAPSVFEFKSKKKHIIKMPQGINVYFYDSLENVNASLVADRAVLDKTTNTFDARGNVVVKNKEKQQQLNTEHLVWKQQEGKIISDEFVKITTQDQIIMGEGLEADENFDYYQINKITGTINLKNDTTDAEMD